MATMMQGPSFIDFDARLQAIQYRLTEHIKLYMSEWSKYLVDLQMKVEFKWTKDPQMLGYRLTVYVNKWVYTMFIDDSLFDHVHKDVNYIEYLREAALRACQTGILTEWLSELFAKTKDGHDLQDVFAKQIIPDVKEILIFKGASPDRPRAGPDDLCHVILKNVAIPVTERVQVIMEEPKYFLARLLVMKE
jgi:hypothetical protein